jgi:hypothetical protein
LREEATAMKVTTWIIATHNSDEAEIYLHKKFGNANDVKDTIWNMILAEKKENEEDWDEDISYTRNQIKEDDDGLIYGCAQFYDYHIDYTAWQLDSIQEVPEEYCERLD